MLLHAGALLRDGARGRAALLVVAHPDDETMFFAPAMLCLARTLELHVLCLSTGDFDGLGARREAEMPKACACLGVPPDRVRLLDDPLLRDGPCEEWPAERIARLVDAELQERSAERVLTFDAHGISQHPNHVSVHRGVMLLAAERRARPAAPLRVYELRSHGLVRRHLSVWDVPLTLLVWWLRRLLGADDIVCVSLRPWAVHRAMREHRSQYVWFRKLYILVSRYVWVNTLVRAS